MSSTVADHAQEMSDDRYIVYHIGDEVYASRLLDIREVIEYQEPKYMPNMENYFSGVINVRGSIVGIVDLRKKFQEPCEVTRTTAILICETEQGSVGAVVDRVSSVLEIEKEKIEEKPPVMSRVDQKYLLGIAKTEKQLITLISIEKALCEMKVVQVSA